MTDINIIEVQTKKDLKAFCRFPMKLYEGNEYYVPPLLADEMATFSREKNPAFDDADAKLFLAMKAGEIQGRIAAVLSHATNHHHHVKDLRFGWFDAVNDVHVAAALFDAVERWGRELGMDAIVGPEGFNGFDRAGMLTEGYDQLPTMATYYNYPYYNDLVTQCGFTTHLNLVEYNILNINNSPFPQRLGALAEKMRARRGYRVLDFQSKKDMLRRAPDFLNLLIEAYSALDSFTPISERQQAYYTKKFFPFLRKELVKAVVNDKDELIGFFIAMPSISRALQKAKGRLLPFGVFHLWNALRSGNTVVDFCLGGVKPDYRGKGVDVIMAAAMHKTLSELGFERGESNPELETNVRVRSEWKNFEHVIHKRRKTYIRPIQPHGAS